MMRSLARYHAIKLGVCLVGAAIACTDDPPTAPAAPTVAFANASGGPSPKVSSTDPSSGPRSSTLFVRVLGSGFTQGTRAIWALKGDTTYAVTKVKTNSTSFVSSGELVANITIQSDASLSLYDVVALTTDGKKGIGIECFTVTIMAITDLGTLGGTESDTYSLNTPSAGNRLLIVGKSQDKAGTEHAAYWYVDLATGARQAGALPAPTGDVRSWAAGVNQSGAIVGASAATVGGNSVPVLWASGSWSPTFLNMNGGTYGSTTRINGAGQILGQIGGLSVAYVALWEGTTLTALDGFGGNNSQAFGMSSAGVVVGMSRYPGGGPGSDRAFIWTTPGPMIQLPDAGYTSSWALAINDAGVIVGSVWSSITGNRAVRWLPPATVGGVYTMEEFGLVNSRAWDINNAGEIVGQYQTGSYIHAFYWINGRTKDLPDLVHNSGARAINENGEVVGWSRLPNNYLHAVLWTHVR